MKNAFYFLLPLLLPLLLLFSSSACEPDTLSSRTSGSAAMDTQEVAVSEGGEESQASLDSSLEKEAFQESTPTIATTPECFGKTLRQGKKFKLCKMMVNDQERWFSYLTPKNSTKNLPLVFSFHGGGADFTKDEQGHIGADALSMVEAWVSLASPYGMLIVVPYGSLMENGTGRWFWKNGDDRNDYRFIEELTKWFEKKYKTDENRVFGTGHSSGGIFLYSWESGGPFNDPVYKTETGHFRAISVSGANLNLDTVEATNKVQSSLFLIHGADDTTQYWQVSEDQVDPKKLEAKDNWVETIEEGGLATTFFHDYSGYWYPVWNPDTASSFGNWKTALGCQESSLTKLVNSCSSNRAYKTCGKNGEAIAELWKVFDCGHPVKASSLRLDFFARFCPDRTKAPCSWGQLCNLKNECVTNPNNTANSCKGICGGG